MERIRRAIIHRFAQWCAMALALSSIALVGCASPVNPSFDISVAEARKELKAIPRRSVPLERPVIVAAGFLDPGFGVSSLATRFKRLAEDPDMVIEVPFFTTPSFDLGRERIITKLEERFPSDDPHETVEVDVIGISMGGLMARFAALPDEEARAAGIRRLRIRTLFTLGTPHHGADRANHTPPFDARVIDMRSGSAFLARLDEAWPDRDYDLVAYTRLRDRVVGPANALSPDREGWWLAPPPFQLSHMNIQEDPRIVLDILCRLRGVPPKARSPMVPMPDNAR